MWEEYKDFLLVTGLGFLQAGVSVYIKTQAQVYIWGRMLGLAKTDRQKNLIALLSIAVFTMGHMYTIDVYSVWFYYVWLFLDIFSIGILWYVLFGFRLFARMDTLQDIKIAKDKSEKRK